MLALDLNAISKRFDEVQALDSASLEARFGEIHAVCGENGAGKSTLLSVGAGLLPMDEGTVTIAGEPLAPHTAREAIARGVGFVAQHFSLFDALSVLENLILGAEPVSALGRLDEDRARARAKDVMRELGATLDLDTRVSTLGIGDKQRLEIAKILFREAKIIVLDEPTAVLTPFEADKLYAWLRRLADAGRAVVVVTHHVAEVLEHADAVTILRHGRVVASPAHTRGDRSPEARRRLVEAMMGEAEPAASARRERAPIERGAVLRLDGAGGFGRLRRATMEVRPGEIVGVAGIEGHGQSELVELLAGVESPRCGALIAESEGPSAVVFGDRHAEGAIASVSLAENVMLGELGRVSRFGFVVRAALIREARKRLKRAGLGDRDPNAPLRTLSGGNQQKLVVARALARVEEGASMLVLAHPTRGVDVAAARRIRQMIADAVTRHAVPTLLVSADLDELRELADRIVVLRDGAIVQELDCSASDRVIGAAMLGDTIEGGAPRSASPSEVERAHDA